MKNIIVSDIIYKTLFYTKNKEMVAIFVINLKSMYKNSKYGILVKTLLFLAIVLLSLGAYFCFAPKNEVSADNDTEYEFKINFKRSDDNVPDLFAGNITVSYINNDAGVDYSGEDYLTLNDDGSYTFKIKNSDLSGDLSGKFRFRFVKNNNGDFYSNIDSVEGKGTKINSDTVESDANWANGDDNREFTVKFAYPNSQKYTKFKITGSGMSDYMNTVNFNSDRNSFEAYNFFNGALGTFEPETINKDKGIIVFKSTTVQGFERKKYTLKEADNIMCTSGSPCDGFDFRPDDSNSYWFEYSTTDQSAAQSSNLFFVNFEKLSPVNINLSGEGYPLGKLVQSCTTVHKDNDGWVHFGGAPEVTIAENDASARIETKMLNHQGETFMEVTLKARGGVTIGDISGSYINKRGGDGNLSIRDSVWDATNRTYTFKMDYPVDIGEGENVLFSVEGSYKQTVINLQGISLDDGSSLENQKLGVLIKQAKVTVNDRAGERTITENISSDDENKAISFDVDNDFGDQTTDKITVELSACDGMDVAKVYDMSGENPEPVSGENSGGGSGRFYTFDITSYPSGGSITYSVEGQNFDYLLQFKDENSASSNRFKVYLEDGSSPNLDEYPQSVNVHYNQETGFVVELDKRYSNSNINIIGHGKFNAEASAADKVYLKSDDGTETIECSVQDYAYLSYDYINGEFYDTWSQSYEWSDVEFVKEIDYNNDFYALMIKLKNDKIRIFKDAREEIFYGGSTLYVSNSITDRWDGVIWYSNENIRYYEDSRSEEKVKYKFELLKPIDINPAEDYFTVSGIVSNRVDVTIKCDKSLSGDVCENLRLGMGNGSPLKFEEGDDNSYYCKIENVKSENGLSFTLASTTSSSLASNYVTWFNGVESNDALGTDNSDVVINKNESEVTLSNLLSDCIITLKKPPLVETLINFKGDDRFYDFINVYKAHLVADVDEENPPRWLYDENDVLTNWSDFGSEKVLQENIGISQFEETSFYYVINPDKIQLVNLDDNKKILENISLTLSNGYNNNITVESTKSNDNTEIHVKVKVNPLIKFKETSFSLEDGFLVNVENIGLPPRKAIFISDKDAAGTSAANFTPVDGWSGNPVSFPGATDEPEEDDKVKSRGDFDFGSDLVFRFGANTNYEISNINECLEISGVETYDSQEYTGEDGKVYYEITIRNVKSNITVIAKNLDPLHKAINFNAVGGLNYYTVGSVTNEVALDNGQLKADAAELGEIIHGKYTVSTGENFYFAVKAEQGYNLESATISGGVKEVTVNGADYRLYKIENVGKDYIISGSISKLKYNVVFERYSNADDPHASHAVTYQRDDVSVDTLEVEYGDSISFTVKIDERYNKSKYRIIEVDNESNNTVEINLVDGKYSVVNITGNKTIKVEGIQINSYNINFVKSDAVKFLNENNTEINGIERVGYDERKSFKIEAKTGYALTDQMKVVSVSESGVRSEIIKDKNGNYSITGITEDYEVSIENVENIMFKVDLTPTDGVTYLNENGAVISGTSKVKYGNNFEFNISIDDAYDDSISGMYITVNNGKSNGLIPQKLATGRYIISNITEDIVIKVGNVRKNSYIVTLVKLDGMDYYNSSKKVINGDNSVNHGDSFSFKIGLLPAYNGSNVKVMLGNEELKANDSGFYTVPKVIENKTVTIIGVEENEEAKVVNTINNLPSNVLNLEDVDEVIAATKDYERLSDDQKQRVSNIDALRRLQEQVKEFHHVSNDVRISGIDWNIKLIAVPISFDKEACTRIYKKLNSEYIVSLYDVYLWDVINDVKYTLPEGQEATITLPKPDLTYFEKPTGIHEKDGGKISFLTLSIGSDIVRFTTDSFSPMGVIANRSLAPGRSSLLDAADANIGLIRDYALSTFGSSGKNKGDSYSDIDLTDKNTDGVNLDGSAGNISEKFKSRNNPVTSQGSAIRLALVLMLLILLAIIIIIVIEGIRRRKKEKND